AEPRPRAPFLGLDQGLAADEATLLVELDAEPDPSLIRGLVRSDVGPPDPVALLQSHRVDGAVAAGDHPVRLTRFPERPPESRPVFRRAIELPAELADVGHPERAHRNVADGDLAQVHVGEGLVAEILWRQRLQDFPR